MTASLGALPPVLPGSTPAVLVAPTRHNPDEPWEMECRYPVDPDPQAARHRAGHHRAMVCGLVTQGGYAGLTAHRRVVHR